MERVKICIGYEFDGRQLNTPPAGADRFERCQPVYIEMPGWQASTVGITDYAQLPAGARDYLAKIEELCEIPIDIISTGPDRSETIIRRHPFDA
jgi:adenylosuccinate synthase